MIFVLEINSLNYGVEDTRDVGLILKQLSDKMNSMVMLTDQAEAEIRDVNGNVVGSWCLRKDSVGSTPE